MAMSEMQIKRRMDEAWELHYKEHDMEAEWYANDEANIWVCDIPSKEITIKMVLDEATKRVSIYEAPLQKQSRYDSVREAEWKIRSHYKW